jgi:hypothetical protein
MAKLGDVSNRVLYPPLNDDKEESAEVTPSLANDANSCCGASDAPLSQLDRALALSRQGIPVVPCRAHDEIDPKTGKVIKNKEAKSPLTLHGFKDATTNEGTIWAWFGKIYPDALVGYPTGEKSGIDIIDLDRKDGKDGVAAMERVCPNLPAPIHGKRYRVASIAFIDTDQATRSKASPIYSEQRLAQKKPASIPVATAASAFGMALSRQTFLNSLPIGPMSSKRPWSATVKPVRRERTMPHGIAPPSWRPIWSAIMTVSSLL